ncbi:MAG: isoleucine--tRNA ligase [Patescibacteria group bacterium]|nr:isoleucine--tRNA ligase [Patescibacteria group bacterium]
MNSMFKNINPKLNLPEEEKRILENWRKEDIFRKTLKKESPKGNFVFYEGPPTANGQPGIHHVEARSFKDLFCRYKTMQGYYVKRKAGWDTHGLPVELQVEKELGISGKPQIENIVPGDKKESIKKFNELCKKSVWRYKEDWEKMTERMAYWVDMEDPYVTYDPKYIESVWNVIAEIDKKGLLYKGHKVVPYCPRCGTALSSHEVAQGYKNIKEETIYIQVKSKKEDVYFLVWTTTPWTLSGNAALAFGPKIEYAIVEKEEKTYIISKNRVEKVLDENTKIAKTLTGEEVIKQYSTEHEDYEPIYPDGEKFSEAGEKSYKLITADYVTDLDGTGIVHIAPAFGEDDYTWGYQKNQIKVLKTVDEKGIELAGAGKGEFVKKADNSIKEDLTSREILLKTEDVAHDYPFCWRCDTPLLYMAKDSWYIAMSKLRKELLTNNEKINWNPAYLKHGRFGNWLEEVKDWAISRDRYWGTPLPVWECDSPAGECKKYKVVSSLSEVNNVDPHKPFIDEIEFDCECGGKMKRTPEVMDVWLDSGAMPFAQYHYPFENEELSLEQFPADFICEAVDQTRGWFYTLLALSTIMKNETAYKNVISVGHVLDEKGKKMSKSLGNVVVPNDAFDKFGADVIRYYFYSVNQPGEPKLYSEKEVTSLSRNLFLTLWNVFSFFVTYASIDKFVPTGKIESTNVLDRWILAKFQELVNEVTGSLDKYDPYKASKSIIDFAQELSTWYVRRSRRRFWKSENDEDKIFAYETLYYILIEMTKLLAPFTPMFSETIYETLKKDSDHESVHLSSFPVKGEINSEILKQMLLVRKIVETGLSLRATMGIKVRQPLSKLTYYENKVSSALEQIIAEEVNVKEVIFDSSGKGEPQLDGTITPELQIEGNAREMIRNIQSLRKKSDFKVDDRIEVCYETTSKELKETMDKMREMIAKEVLAVEIIGKRAETEGEEEFSFSTGKIWIGISRKEN